MYVLQTISEGINWKSWRHPHYLGPRYSPTTIHKLCRHVEERYFSWPHCHLRFLQQPFLGSSYQSSKLSASKSLYKETETTRSIHSESIVSRRLGHFNRRGGSLLPYSGTCSEVPSGRGVPAPSLCPSYCLFSSDRDLRHFSSLTQHLSPSANLANWLLLATSRPIYLVHTQIALTKSPARCFSSNSNWAKFIKHSNRVMIS